MPRPPQEPPPRRRKSHHYWWFLANTLALCAVILSWVLFLHVFGHPEIPRNYEIIRWFGRTEEPPGFRLQDAPPGEAADPRALYRRYAELDEDSIARLNAALLRNYLSGLEETGLIQYVEGEFEVVATRSLDASDLFHPGFAVRSRAMVQPDEFSRPQPWPVVIDYLFPTDATFTRDWFRPGDSLTVAKVPNCAMVLHVSRIEAADTPELRLTVVPIAMGNYRIGKERTFEIRPPESLNPACRLPPFEENAEDVF